MHVQKGVPLVMLSLEKKLKNIEKIFDTNDIYSIKVDKNYVAQYYKVNQLAYSLFHTLSDRIYMGVSRDGVYKHADLLEAARTVEEYIKKVGASRVLELATGRGANSEYLVKKFPQIQFHGIDLSSGQLYFAKKRAQKYDNYFPIQGDYHNLAQYADNSINVCFVVEALCYSTDKQKVLLEVQRVLKPGGVFIIFDGYLHKPWALLTQEEELASKLTEVGMAVEKFEEYQSFRKTISTQSWEIISEENVSMFVLPTMQRFEKLANLYIKHPRGARIFNRFFPKEFVYNALSGYLMPTLIKQGVANYMITILRKQK